jgi:hypothetical protein
MSMTSLISTSGSALDAIFGKPPLLPGEDEAAYQLLSHEFRKAMSPRDMFEEILIREAIDLTWEIQRLKDFKRQLVHSKRDEALKKILIQYLGYDGYEKEAYQEWTEGKDRGIKKVNDFLNEKGLDPSVINALSFNAQIDTMETYDRLIMQAEARRSAHFRVVNSHRLSLAEAMRNKANTIEANKILEHKSGDE